MQYTHHNEQRGFTIVELLIVTPMVILVVALMIGYSVSLTGDALVSRERTNTTFVAQNALNRIEQDVRLSYLLYATSGTLTSPQGSNNGFTGTSAFANPASYLVLGQYATSTSPNSRDRALIYYANRPNACGANQEYNESMKIMVIYYLDGTTLKRRTVLPSYVSSDICGTPWQRNSCKTGLSTSDQCRATDEVIAEDVSSLSFAYYNAASDTDTIDEPTEETTTVLATMTVSKSVAGRTASSTNVIRVSAIGVE